MFAGPFRWYVGFVPALAAAVLAASSARADIVSTFDTDTDGWTVFQNDGATVNWLATGGNPNGHITAIDVGLDWAYVQAPAKFLVPGLYGGTLSFDLRVLTTDGSPALPGRFNVRVGLQGAGITLINEASLPTTDWQSYSFDLVESSAAGWRKFSNLSQNYDSSAPLVSKSEFKSVLAGLTRIVIATDYTYAAVSNNVLNEPLDQTYIDNVRLSAVPEPSSLVLLSIGACVTAFGCSRRRNGGIADAA